MITAIHRKNLIPFFALLFALAGMTFSVIGGASSHGVAELSGFVSEGQNDHSHSHNDSDGKSDIHLHHDAGNHSHESVDHPTIRPISDYSISLWQRIPYAGDSPRSFRYRLDRPPKASLIV
ncbi:hypothetical protein [Marinobacter vinifirmus]|uniref:Uncharacterized protein n=1 Tax=Marinobacter vinifirmus TaxID=355591 RepID=A0A558B282_9GAMM|nr:hypothetical protein [Marinobacter vinifirmus]TVT30619.1 MAG: hypothetical protein FHK81_16525 [Marinobacter vinifirmus]